MKTLINILIQILSSPLVLIKFIFDFITAYAILLACTEKKPGNIKTRYFLIIYKFPSWLNLEIEVIENNNKANDFPLNGNKCYPIIKNSHSICIVKHNELKFSFTTQAIFSQLVNWLIFIIIVCLTIVLSVFVIMVIYSVITSKFQTR